jgi:hypothetical protein
MSNELKRMGASIQVDGKVAVIESVEYLTAPWCVPAICGGAALVIAGIAARGQNRGGKYPSYPNAAMRSSWEKFQSLARHTPGNCPGGCRARDFTGYITPRMAAVI